MSRPDVDVEIAFLANPGASGPQKSASFSRSSVAYKSDGTQVSADTPRFETVDGRTGLLVEERTTNLLSATNSQGFSSAVNVTVTVGKKYTVSMTGSGSIALSGAGTGTVTALTPVTFTASTTTLTLTPTGDTGRVQVEQKAYKTSWQIGGTARNNEVFKIPTAGVISLDGFTIEAWMYPIGDITLPSSVDWHFLLDVYDGSSSLNRIVFTKTPCPPFSANYWYLRSNDYSGQSTTAGFTWACSPGWHLFTLIITPSKLAVYVDGVLKSSKTNPYLPNTLPQYFYLGSNYGPNSHVNSPIGPLRISSRARTDSEILAAYQSGTLTYDSDTTYLLPLESDLSYLGGEWRNVGRYTRALSIRRGRQHELDRFEAGTSHATLDNRDRRFDPTYTSGPYYPYVFPMRRFRVSAEHNSTRYYLFTGFIESWPQRWPGGRDAVVEVDATDGFKVLNLKKLSGSYSEQLSSARISAILDAASWPAADRDISTGQTTVQASTLSDTAALQHLQDVSQTENGRLFCDGRGRIVFHDRHRPLKPPYDASVATFGDGDGELPYTDLEMTYDESQVWNEIIVQRVGGTAQTASDATSQSRYLVRTLSRTNMLQTSDTECADAANWLLSHFKDAQLRVTAITICPDADDGLWEHVLGREIGDRISIVRRPPGGGDAISRDYIIEGIEHDITPTLWQTRWRLSPAETLQYWVLGHTTLGVLGSTTRLAY